MHVRPVDPRDERWEREHPTYRVTFWTEPNAPGSWHADEWELAGGEVTDVLAWIDEHGAGRRFTLHAATPDGDGVGLVRLAGDDPTRG